MAELDARIPCTSGTRAQLRDLCEDGERYEDVLEWVIPIAEEVDLLRKTGESPVEAADWAIRVLREHRGGNT